MYNIIYTHILEVLKGLPLRVNFENAGRRFLVRITTPTKQGKGVQQGSGILKQHLFEIDPLPWTLNFLSALLCVGGAQRDRSFRENGNPLVADKRGQH